MTNPRGLHVKQLGHLVLSAVDVLKKHAKKNGGIKHYNYCDVDCYDHPEFDIRARVSISKKKSQEQLGKEIFHED